MEKIIQNICTACNLNEEDAKVELDATLRNLRELRDEGMLRHSDYEDACSGLGLDFDYTTYFIQQLAF